MNLLRELENGWKLNGAEATAAFGQTLGRQIAEGTVIGLHGDLGAGKTTLAKGIAAGWGIAEPVKSPTFNYFLLYQGERGIFAHLDAYRIREEEEYDSLLLEEMLGEHWLLVVEWAERVERRLPHPTLHLHLTMESETDRLIRSRAPLSPTLFPHP